MMPRLTALAVLAALALPGAAHAVDIEAPLKATNGDSIGTVQATAAPSGVLMRVTVKKLQPGWHGIHLHATADCSDAKFEKAGGHVNHTPKLPHGLLNPDGHDFGDLPNIHVASDGTGAGEFYTEFVRLKTGDATHPALLDEDGSALVIHGQPDDHHTQPIGGAGARVACAAIKQ